jgi:hypothetical protein
MAAVAEQDDPQTSMQFCKECNNLMYPKEVRETESTESRLVYVCKVLASPSTGAVFCAPAGNGAALVYSGVEFDAWPENVRCLTAR